MLVLFQVNIKNWKIFHSIKNRFLFAGYCSEGADRDRSLSTDSSLLRFSRPSRKVSQQQSTTEESLTWIPEKTPVTTVSSIVVQDISTGTVETQRSPPTTVSSTSSVTVNVTKHEDGYLSVPGATIVASNSSDTLTTIAGNFP